MPPVGPAETHPSGKHPPPPPAELPRVDATSVAPFLAASAGLGARAVPELLRRLLAEEDVAYQPRWLFRDGRPEGYPSLHAIYLLALCGIEGKDASTALLRYFRDKASLEESYLVAAELTRRGEGGWADTALERSAVDPDPARLPVQLALAELAAKADPSATMREVIGTAPRGEDGRDPRVLATTLRAIPLGDAAAATENLLRDPDVTPRAKARYVQALLGRPEWETLSQVREICARGGIDESVRTAICHEAANSPAFINDIADHQQALAREDRVAADAVRTRFLRRIEETHRLASVALNLDFETSPDPVAANLRRTLERYVEQFGR